MFKSLVTLQIGLVFFTINANAQYFTKYPELNDKVADFTSAFIQNLVPEVIQSRVTFDFNEDAKGIKKTNLAYGQIEGKYTGIAKDPQTSEESNLLLNFKIYLEDAPIKPKEPAEYAINLKAEGSISNSKNFMKFFIGMLSPECVEDNNLENDGALGEVCRAFIESKYIDSKSSADNAFDILMFWKMKLLESLTQNKNPGFNKVSTELITYLEKRINITKSSNATTIEIKLENLANDFSAEAKEFLKEKKLIDFSLKNLKATVDNDKITYSAYLTKLHVKTELSKMIAYGAVVPRALIESVTSGATAGALLRANRQAAISMVKGVQAMNGTSAAIAGALENIFGKQSSEGPSEAEQELGFE